MTQTFLPHELFLLYDRTQEAFLECDLTQVFLFPLLLLPRLLDFFLPQLLLRDLLRRFDFPQLLFERLFERHLLRDLLLERFFEHPRDLLRAKKMDSSSQ